MTSWLNYDLMIGLLSRGIYREVRTYLTRMDLYRDTQ